LLLPTHETIFPLIVYKNSFHT